jgi:hypothetical protein
MRQVPSKPLLAIAFVAALATAAYLFRDAWMPLFPSDTSASSSKSPPEARESTPPPAQVLLSDQAIGNLGLRAKPVKPQTYWKTIQVPGMVVDLPGRSDRGVVSPISGVVSKVNIFPGDTKPGNDWVLVLDGVAK